MLTRRDFARTATAAVAASGLAAPRIARGAAAASTLRIIHASDLVSVDPIWTTAPPTKDYAFLTYDQLLGVDAAYTPRPQMADGWSVEDDGRSYVFTLREGLTFHDGEPVRSADCIASIRRWSARDGFGQAVRRVTDRMEAIDDRRFRIRLTRPFPLLPAALGKSNSSQCFIMPERSATVDPMKQVTETVGCGPYRFVKEEWVPGVRAVWARFDGYRPRSEPVSGIAGGRIPAVERVEWAIIGDAATALAALQQGEQDYWDSPPADLVAAIQARPNLAADIRNTSGSYAMLQFNHLQPPFNNPAIRQAVAMAVDQQSFIEASVGRPDMIHPCDSFYACGTAYGTDTGGDVLKVRSVERAKAALNAAGYNGERVVLLAVADSPLLSPMSQVGFDILRRSGMNVDFVTTDFAQMAQRRTNRGPVDQGGWSAFLTVWSGTDVLNPAVNQMLRGGGTKDGWFGWADDPHLEQLRTEWFDATDPAAQTRLAAEIQTEAFKTLPYIPLGSVTAYVAYSRSLTGMFPCPVAAYWNIGKTA